MARKGAAGGGVGADRNDPHLHRDATFGSKVHAPGTHSGHRRHANTHSLACIGACMCATACVLFVRTSWASMVPTKAFSSGSQKNAICCFAHAVVGPMTCGVPA